MLERRVGGSEVSWIGSDDGVAPVSRLAWPVSGGGARRREAPERGGPCREPAWLAGWRGEAAPLIS